MKNIIKRMRQYYPLSEEAIDELRQLTIVQERPQGHLLIEAGKLAGYLYFIEKGLSRSFCIINGNEVNSWFSYEGDMTFSLNELYFGTAGFESVELLEDSLLYAVPIKEFNELQEVNLEICNWSRICHQHHLHRTQCSRLAQLSLSAEERYLKLLAEQPKLMQRIPLKYIASHLGVTPQSLSRVRANLNKNTN